MAKANSILRQSKGADRLIGYGAVVVLVLHVASLFMPAIEVERLFFFTDIVTIWGAITALFSRGEILIGLVLFLFTVVFPALKLAAIIHLFLSPSLGDPTLEKRLSRLDSLGKWSMLDVFVAALLVVSLTATGLVDARFLPGMYLFALSVILTLLLSSRLSVLARRHLSSRNV
ncbi:MAG: paraquat-inducible protein A [Alphaproteobacteria bacterium]